MESPTAGKRARLAPLQCQLTWPFHVLEGGVGLVETLKTQFARLVFALRLCTATYLAE